MLLENALERIERRPDSTFLAPLEGSIPDLTPPPLPGTIETPLLVDGSFCATSLESTGSSLEDETAPPNIRSRIVRSPRGCDQPRMRIFDPG